MPFPSTNVRKTLGRTLDEIQDLARNTKTTAQAMHTALETTDVPGEDVLRYAEGLGLAKARFQAAASMPGLRAFAQEELEDQSLDLAAEFIAMISAIDGVRAWVATNYPKSPDGYLHISSILNGNINRLTFSPAQTAGLRAEITSLIATID